MATAVEIATAPAPVGGSVAVRLGRWLPALTVLVVLVGVLVGTGTAPTDIARYAAYLTWAVVLPGTLVYRALRRSPHSLVDDLAMGSVVGLVLEIAALVLFSATQQHGTLWLWPLLVVVPFTVVPALRRHWRPGGYRSAAPVGWSWGVAGVAIALVAYLTAAFLRHNQPVPIGRPQSYFIDELFYLSLAGEIRHRFPFEVPAVAGEPLAYHWFFFGNVASGSLISRVDTPMVLFRLALPALCVLCVVLLSVAGWRVSGRPWVGATAAALTFGIGELTVGSYSIGPLGGVTEYIVWGSPSFLYGQAFAFALIVLVADRLGGARESSLGRGGWPLLALVALATPGAKSTVLPVMLCGVGLVCLVQVIRRRLTAPAWLAAGILAASQVLATAVLYRFESGGVRISPLAILDWYITPHPNRPFWKELVLVGVALTGYTIFMFTRLAGLPVLVRLRRRDWAAVHWFLLGGLLGGAAGVLLLWHPSWSENFFVRTGFPFGAILSAMGLVALVDRHRVGPRTLVAITTGSVAVASVLSYLLMRGGGWQSGPGYRGMLPIFRMAAAIAIVALAVVVAAQVARRRWPRLGALGAVSVLVLALTAGVAGPYWDARIHPNAAGAVYHKTVTPQQAEVARFVRDRSDAYDVLATNAHCVEPSPPPCNSLSFWLSAFSERRVLLESWAYTHRAHDIAAATRSVAATVPFWDPDRLAMNDAAFYAPSGQVMDWLQARGVRWLVVDRRFGRESPALRDYASPALDRGEVAVYELARH